MDNKWVVLLDECDYCNAKFSLYEGALADAVAPLLTLGGVKGKGSQVGQTGRSSGSTVLTSESGPERRRILAHLGGCDMQQLVGLNPASGRLLFKVPLAGVPFRPRHAMALALLPDAELADYAKLRAWLLDPIDGLDFPVLDVALSMRAIGNAPPLAVGMLLRHNDPQDLVPHILFLFLAGSVCLQIDLLSDDHKDRQGRPRQDREAVDLLGDVADVDSGRSPVSVLAIQKIPSGGLRHLTVFAKTVVSKGLSYRRPYR
ncbi:MAG TPA: hypothetical protein VGN75_00455 [Kaistia sp.]|nr:hypothetical protein [Kaistia sp.]